MPTKLHHLTENDSIEDILIESAIDQLEILPAVISIADTDGSLAIEDLEKFISVELLNELPIGSQIPIRDVTVTEGEELKATEFSARAKAFKGVMKASTADLKKLEEAKDFTPDQFINGIGGRFKRPVKSALKAVEIALQNTETTNPEESIPSLYEMSKQGIFAGIDGDDFPAFQAHYIEQAGTKEELSKIGEKEVFPKAFLIINQMIKALKKCGAGKGVIFAGSNAYQYLDNLKDNNKEFFDKDKFDFDDNKYFGLPIIELDHAKWTTDKKFSNRVLIFGVDSIQARMNKEHLTATEGDGIEPIGDSRTIKKITVFLYLLLTSYNRAGCGQVYFPDLEMPTVARKTSTQSSNSSTETPTEESKQKK